MADIDHVPFARSGVVDRCEWRRRQLHVALVMMSFSSGGRCLRGFSQLSARAVASQASGLQSFCLDALISTSTSPIPTCTSPNRPFDTAFVSSHESHPTISVFPSIYEYSSPAAHQDPAFHAAASSHFERSSRLKRPLTLRWMTDWSP